MAFSKFMNETVILCKKDGTTHNFKAMVQPTQIFTDDSRLPVEEGDVIERKLPNGTSERYVVIERGYMKGVHNIPDHYQMKVRKVGTSQQQNIMPKEVASGALHYPLISPQLIASLQEAKPNSFDASRLAEYCREINSAFTQGNLISCLLLMRAVLNHVPPVFGHTDFSQVVAQASRSLKDNFEHLDESLRKIADLYTHQHMRKKEHLPTPGQVEKFGPQFELLLQEVLTRL